METTTDEQKTKQRCRTGTLTLRSAAPSRSFRGGSYSWNTVFGKTDHQGAAAEDILRFHRYGQRRDNRVRLYRIEECLGLIFITSLLTFFDETVTVRQCI